VIIDSTSYPVRAGPGYHFDGQAGRPAHARAAGRHLASVRNPVDASITIEVLIAASHRFGGKIAAVWRR
jgi:hypothetical protein